MLAEALLKSGNKVHKIGFPERTSPIGQKINEYLRMGVDLDDRVVHLLYSANRWEHSSDLAARLQAGENLVVDRYAFSGVAYSSAKGLDSEWCKSPDKGLPAPDLVVFLKVPLDAAADREHYGEERYEKTEFQKKVAVAFDSLSEPDWMVLDAKQDRDEIHSQVMSRVLQLTEARATEPISLLWSQGHWKTLEKVL